jgi:fusion and transport protein UGO1
VCRGRNQAGMRHTCPSCRAPTSDTTMSSPGSLRELYAPPPTSWTFESVADRVSVPAGSDPSPSVSHQWPTRPSTNSVLDLSPSLGESGANATELVRAVLASALMQYTTTAMIMPFEVGKTLLQVQWVPRDAEDLPEADPEVEEEKLEEVSRT